jgi:hypothetical protein
MDGWVLLDANWRIQNTLICVLYEKQPVQTVVVDFSCFHSPFLPLFWLQPLGHTAL